MAIAGVREYLALHFPEVDMSDTEIAQLAWSIRPGNHSPEKAMIEVVGAEPSYIEVRRCISRLYCEQQLHQANYQALVQNQPTDNEYLPALTQGQFARLNTQFVEHDQLTRDCLRVSTIVSSVPLSSKAREQADTILGKNNYTQDSVEFLADTFRDIENAKQIYPLVAELFAKYPQPENQVRITKLLQAAFPSKQHFRHMMYTEGNQTMFDALLSKVRRGEYAQEVFQFWVAHWTINITGFRGHINPKGSLYLTSNTFEAMQALQETLARVFNEEAVSSTDLLNDYLDKRWQMVFGDVNQLSDRMLSLQEKHLLAHLAAMMRVHHPEEGEALWEGFRLIPKTVIKKLQNLYFSVPAANEPTPTYAPAIFENGVDLRKAMLKNEDAILHHVEEHFLGQRIKKRADSLKRLIAIADVVVGLLPLYLEGLRVYQEARRANRMNANQPLSFMGLANKQEVINLLGESPIFKQFNILRHATVMIDQNGALTLQPKVKAKDRIQQAGQPIVNHYGLRSKSKVAAPGHAPAHNNPPALARRIKV